MKQTREMKKEAGYIKGEVTMLLKDVDLNENKHLQELHDKDYIECINSYCTDLKNY